jgi:hypothetical protein
MQKHLDNISQELIFLSQYPNLDVNMKNPIEIKIEFDK